MKKILNLLLVSSFLLTFNSCGNNQISHEESSNKQSTTESENSIKESEDVSSSSEEEVSESIIDLSTRSEHKFVDIEELYLLPNESYYISQMLLENESVSNFDYITDISNSLTIDSTNGMIIANDVSEFDEDAEIVGNLYLYNDNQYQDVIIHIVDKEEYGNYFMSVDKGRLYHKNVIFFGDSITHNWARYTHEGDIVPGSNPNSLGYATHYIPRLNNVCHFNKAINAGWSGGTMAYLPKSTERLTWKSLPGSIEAHKEDIKEMEYVFIFYGTNDLTDQVPIGKNDDTMTIDTKNDCSFKASMKYSIETIQELNPNAKIIFFNLLFRTYVYSGKITENDYNNAIEDMCTAYLLKMIDISHLFNRTNFSGNTKYSNDGLHPNEAGYEVLAHYILTGENIAQ